VYSGVLAGLLQQQVPVPGLPLPGLPLPGLPGLELGRPVPALLRGYSLVGLGVALFISSLIIFFSTCPNDVSSA
jgi:hypothetical protein